LVPDAVPSNVGSRETRVDLTVDGDVVLPGQARATLQVKDASKLHPAVTFVQSDGQSFVELNGKVEQAPPSSVGSGTEDFLGYVAAATRVQRVAPTTLDGTSLDRYTFTVDGNRLTAYLHDKVAQTLKQQVGANVDVTASSVGQLSLSGTGELWVDAQGLPRRQILDLTLPNASPTYRAQVHLVVDFRDFGQVGPLPRPVRGADGQWQLTAPATGNAAATSAPPVSPPSAAIPTGASTASGSGEEKGLSTDDPRIATITAKLNGGLAVVESWVPGDSVANAVALLVALGFGVAIVVYRRRRWLYPTLSGVVIASLVFGPVLQNVQLAGIVSPAAAKASAAELTSALGLDSPPAPNSPASPTVPATITLTPVPFPKTLTAEPAESTSRIPTLAVPPQSPVPLGSAPATSTAIPTLPTGTGAPGVAFTTPSRPRNLTAPATTGVTTTYPANPCGYGSETSDGDSDGLSDATEACLGTDPLSVDSTGSGLPDGLKVYGTDVCKASDGTLSYPSRVPPGTQSACPAGTTQIYHLVGDPNRADSNGDGIPDAYKWPQTTYLGQTYGLAKSWDYVDQHGNHNGIPNVWNTEIAGDNVPNNLSLSPFASTDYLSHFDLSLQGSGYSGYAYVELQVQPQNLDHLLYPTATIDWPTDDKGQIEHLPNTNLGAGYTDSLRLIPMLQIDTNAVPTAQLAQSYGVTSGTLSTGGYQMLVPLQPFGDGTNTYGLYARIAYGPDPTTGVLPSSIQWSSRLVWLVQGKTDQYVACADPANPSPTTCQIQTTTNVIQVYSDTFRVTGLNITKSQNYEAALFATPNTPTEDANLVTVMLGLSATFMNFETLGNQTGSETALQAAIASLQSDPNDWGLDPTTRVVTSDVTYPYYDAGIAGVSSQLQGSAGFLSTNFPVNASSMCSNAAGNTFPCASVVIAFQENTGTADLSTLPQTPTADGQGVSASLDLATVTTNVTRGIHLATYEQNAGGSWSPVDPASLMEIVNQRYSGANLQSVLADAQQTYPYLQTPDIQVSIVMAYLALTAGRVAVMNVGGQTQAPNSLNVSVPSTVIPKLVGYKARSVGMVYGVLSGMYAVASNARQDFYNSPAYRDQVYDINEMSWVRALGKGSLFAGSLKATFMVTTVAYIAAQGIVQGLVLSCQINPNLQICQNNVALQNTIKVFSSVQSAISFGNSAALAYKYGAGILTDVTKVAKASAVVGLLVNLGIIWGEFGVFASHTPANSIEFNEALVTAIAATIFSTVLAILSAVPIADILVAIYVIVDTLVQVFTGISISGEVVNILAGIFYNVNAITTVNEAAYVAPAAAVDTAAPNPNVPPGDPTSGLMVGSRFKFTDDFQSYVFSNGQGVWVGGADAVNSTSLTGGYTLTAPDGNATVSTLDSTTSCTYGFEGFDRTCDQLIGAEALFTQAKRDVHLQLNTVTNYTLPVQTCYLIFACVLSSQSGSQSGQTSDVYVDVLPDSVDGLWTWSELNNPLATLHWTNPFAVDSDHDGLSDGLELMLGSNPNNADTAGSGLADGVKVCHWSGGAVSTGGALAGGWLANLPGGIAAQVCANPTAAASGADGIPDAIKLANHDSPFGLFFAPQVNLSVTPVAAQPGQPAATFVKPGDPVTVSLSLNNGGPTPITDPLTVCVPSSLSSVQASSLTGDVTLGGQSQPNGCGTDGKGTLLSWDFAGSNPLNPGGQVSASLTATAAALSQSNVQAMTASVSDGTRGWSGTDKVAVDVDNPLVTLTSPTTGAVINPHQSQTLVVGGNASDPTSWLAGVSVNVGNGTFVPATLNPSTCAASTTPDGQPCYDWAQTWNIPGDGVYNLQAQATDLLGHQSTSPATSVVVDGTPPVVTLNGANGAFVKPGPDGATVSLSGTATDPVVNGASSGIATTQISLDGQPWRAVGVNGSGSSVTWSYNWQLPSASAQGKHTVAVRAFDAAGNVSQTVQQSVVVDGLAPTVSLTTGFFGNTPQVPLNQPIAVNGIANDAGRAPLPPRPTALAGGTSAPLNAPTAATVWLEPSAVADYQGGINPVWLGSTTGDGLADLAIGLPGAGGGTGKVALVYGQGGNWAVPPAVDTLANSPTTFVGGPGAKLGSLVASGGDLNGDGKYDLLVGDPANGRAFVVFGQLNPFGQNVILGDTVPVGVTVLTVPAGWKLTTLAPAGDVNGAGFGSILVGAINPATQQGTLYLILGQANPWPATIDVTTAAAVTLPFSTGQVATGVGDVANTGLTDFVVGDPQGVYGGGSAAYLFAGSKSWSAGSNLALSPLSNATRITGTAPVGASVVALGNVTSAPTSDFLVSSGAGPLFVYESTGQTLPSTYLFSATQYGLGAGGFLAAPGDVNASGHNQILLGTSSGNALLFPGGDVTSPTFGQVQAELTGVTGAASAPYAAGADLNCDGSSDLLLVPTGAAAAAVSQAATRQASAPHVAPSRLPVAAGHTSLVQSAPPTGKEKPVAAAPAKASVNASASAPVTSLVYVDGDYCATCANDGLTWQVTAFSQIQDAVNAAKTGTEIQVNPGTYAPFSISNAAQSGVSIVGVNPDAVFVDAATPNGSRGTTAVAISGASGVTLQNLTLRNANSAIQLRSAGVGGATDSTKPIILDTLVVYNDGEALDSDHLSTASLTRSTLVGTPTQGSAPIISVSGAPDPAYSGSWSSSPIVGQVATGSGDGITTLGGSLWVMNPIGNAFASYTPKTSSWSFDGALPFCSLGTCQTLTSDGNTNFYALVPNQASTVQGSVVRAEVVAPNGDVYLGGNFSGIKTTQGTVVQAANVAVWSSGAWKPLGQGVTTCGTDAYQLTNCVNTIAVSADGSHVYVGGSFVQVTDANGTTHAASGFAVWSPSTGTWTVPAQFVNPVNPGVDATDPYGYDVPHVSSIAVVGSSVIVGGHFSVGPYDCTQAIDGTQPSGFTGIWDLAQYNDSTNSWQLPFGTTAPPTEVSIPGEAFFCLNYYTSGFYNPQEIAASEVSAIDVGASGQVYVVGRYYSNLCNPTTNASACFAFPGGPQATADLVTVEYNYNTGLPVLAGMGWFNNAVHSVVGGAIPSGAPDPLSAPVTIGGEFTASNVGMIVYPFSLTFNFNNFETLVCGQASTSAAYLATDTFKWPGGCPANTNLWVTYAGGANGAVRALAPAAGGGFLAAGDFTKIGSTSVNYIAQISSAGVPTGLSSGTNCCVKNLAVNGTNVYAVGTFTTAGGGAAGNFAHWNGTTWNPYPESAGGFQFPLSFGGWVPFTALPFAVDNGTATVVGSDGVLYALVNNAANQDVELWSYSFSAGTWTKSSLTITWVTSGGAAGPGTQLVSANGMLDAILGGSLYQINGTSGSWTKLGAAPFANGAGAGLTWDGGNFLYLTEGGGTGGFARFDLVDDLWQTLSNTPDAVSGGSGLVRIGSTLYALAGGGTPWLMPYGPVDQPAPTKLSLSQVAMVQPTTTGTYSWTNWSSLDDDFGVTGTNDLWVGGTAWAPASLPLTPVTSTLAAANFLDSANNVYRISSGSSLVLPSSTVVGYSAPHADAYVSPLYCASCANDGYVWGTTAFASIQNAIDSGAPHVYVEPGAYPEAIYLVNGVQVYGSGADLTILEPPAGSTSTPSGGQQAASAVTGYLASARGVLDATLGNLTIAGPGPTGSFAGFRADGGAEVQLSRAIIRDVATGVQVSGYPTTVNVLNDDLVEDGSGFLAASCGGVNVSNTVFADNLGTGVQFTASSYGSAACPSAAQPLIRYLDFFNNGQNVADGAQNAIGAGSLVADPSFTNPAANNFQPLPISPLVNAGDPSDPVPPGAGSRVEIGYLQSGIAGVTVNANYCATCVNDGLTWQVNAFSQIQPALTVAARQVATLSCVLTSCPAFTVGVAPGTYTGPVTVPSFVSLIGSGATQTTLTGGGTGSVVTFSGAEQAAISDFTITGSGSGASDAGISLASAANAITVTRNLLSGDHTGARLAGGASGSLLFNTIVNSAADAVDVTDPGTNATLNDNILDGSGGIGLATLNGGQAFHNYNLLYQNAGGDFSGTGLAASPTDLTGRNPQISSGNDDQLGLGSPAVDAADPTAPVPPGGGTRADIGYSELTAAPLLLLFGQEGNSCTLGNSGVANVQLAIVPVSDPTQPITVTAPSATQWQPVTLSAPGTTAPSWTTSVLPTIAGLYRLYAMATDEVGNQSTDPNDWYKGSFFAVNPSALPAVTWVAPANDETIGDAAISLTATASEYQMVNGQNQFTIASAGFEVDGVFWPGTWATSGWSASSGQPRTFSAIVPLSDPANHQHLIVPVAFDQAGQQGSAPIRTITMSSTGNVATITSPAGGASVNQMTVPVSGYARFPSFAGLEQVTVTVDGSQAFPATVADPAATLTAWSTTVTLPSGGSSHTLSATATQASSARAMTTFKSALIPAVELAPEALGGTTTLTVDPTPPTIAITAPMPIFPTATAYISQTVIFQGTAADTGSGVSLVQISLDGGNTWLTAALNSCPAGQSCPWSFPWTPPPGQAGFTQVVKARATDGAGNQATVSQSFVVDDVPPVAGTVTATTADYPTGLPVGTHLAAPESLTLSWTPPTAGIGVTTYLVVDQSPGTVPSPTNSSLAVSGTTSTVNLSAGGAWYAHFNYVDLSGNQTIVQIGPWYVDNLATTSCSLRAASIIVDGTIGVANGEWRAPASLLDYDLRSGQQVGLSAEWGASALYVAWQGAAWPTDGTLWIYVGTGGPGGTTPVVPLPGGVLPSGGLPLNAAYAIDVASPTNGTLWQWSGASWTSAGPLTFASVGQDTEVELPWNLSTVSNLSLLAYAVNSTGQPWSVFPTTNPVNGTWSTAYSWSSPCAVTSASVGEPQTRNVILTIASAADVTAPAAPTATLPYTITVQSNDPRDLTGLQIQLQSSAGLQLVSAAGCPSCGALSGSSATLSLAPLPAFTAQVITVLTRVVNPPTGTTSVTTSATLSLPGLGSAPPTGSAATARPAVQLVRSAPIARKGRSTATSGPGALPLSVRHSSAVGLPMQLATKGAVVKATSRVAPADSVNPILTTISLSQTIDNQPPTAQVAPGQLLAPGPATIVGSASSPSGVGIQAIQICVLASCDPNVASDWTNATGTNQWSANVTVPLATSLAGQVRAIDGDGLVGAAQAFSLPVVSVPPFVGFSLPAQVTGGQFAVTGTAAPAKGGGPPVTIEVQVDSDTSPWLVTAGPFAPDTGGNQSWTFPWLLPVENGTAHQLRARAIDAAGNAGFTDANGVVNAATPWQTTTVYATEVDGVVTIAATAASASPGSPFSYTLTIASNGPNAIATSVISDTFPSALTGITWTCAATAGSTCAVPSGNGNLQQPVAIAVGGSLVYTIQGTLAANASGTLSNSATLTLPAGAPDANPANLTATVDVPVLLATATPTATATDTSTPTSTATATPTATSTATTTSTSTPTSTDTATSTATSTGTATATASATPTNSATVLPSSTSTPSTTPTATGTFTTTSTSSPTASATNTATLSPTPAVTPTAACAMCVLNPTASGALSLSGNVVVAVSGPNGVVDVNSTSSTALIASGNASLRASVIGVVGGASIRGNAQVFPPPQSTTPVPDPFAAIPTPSLTGTVLPAVNVSGNSNLTAGPGIYPSLTVSGNGILTLQPGVYVVTQSVSITGNGKLRGSGVTLYLACGSSSAAQACVVGQKGATFVLSGNGSGTFSAPSTGPYANLAIFADRNNVAPLTLASNVPTTLSGGIYLKSGTLSLSGNAATQLGAPLVVDTASLAGNGRLTVKTLSSGLSIDEAPDASAADPPTQTPTAILSTLTPLVDVNPSATPTIGNVTVMLGPQN
jgi:hypothetical protein